MAITQTLFLANGGFGNPAISIPGIETDQAKDERNLLLGEHALHNLSNNPPIQTSDIPTGEAGLGDFSPCPAPAVPGLAVHGDFYCKEIDRC
jgi:hypothetical protein